MRADARRNYDRIVGSRARCFREQGYDASLDEVARAGRRGAQGTLTGTS